MLSITSRFPFRRAGRGLPAFAGLLLSTGLMAARPAAAGPALRVWSFDHGLEGWRPVNWARVTVKNGVLDGRTRFDPQLVSPVLNLRAADYPELLVRVQSDTADAGEVFFASPGQGFRDEIKARHRLPAGPKFVLHRIRLAGAPGWNGVIERIRFDPLNAAGAHVRIDFIALLPKGTGRMLNGGAELAENGRPFEWTPAPAGARRVRATPAAPAHSGQWFLRAAAGGWWETRLFDLSFLNPIHGRLFVRAPAIRPAKLQVSALFFDLRENELSRKLPATIAAGKRWTEARFSITPPRRAAAVRFRFRAISGSIDLDDLAVVFGPPAAITTPLKNAQAGRPNWHASWIWHPALLDRDHTRAFFRRTITLPAPPWRVAAIQVTADDGYALFVNGKKVHQTFGERDGWRTPEFFDLRSLLRPGKNRIDIEARDETSAQGLLAEVLVAPKTGPVRRWGTDSSWSAALEPGGPWSRPAVLGRPPCPPWGALPFRVMAPPVPVHVQFSAVPHAGKTFPGRVDFALELRADSAGASPVFAEAAIEQKGRVLLRTWAPRPLFPGNPKAGAVDAIHDWSASLPWTLRSGRADIRLSLYGGRPVPGAHTVLALDFHRDHPAPMGRFPRCRVQLRNGLARIVVNGREVAPTQVLFLRPDPMHLENARTAGIRIWGVELQEAGFYETGYDYSKVDQTLARYRRADPNAWWIVNLIFDGRYCAWWIRKHPEVHARLENGSDIVAAYQGARGHWPSMSSPVWRAAYADLLRHLIRHLRTTPFAQQIIGIQPCAGITWEWFHWGAQSGELVDYSPAGQADFRRWLRRKYGSDAALQAAWHNAKVRLDSAAVPSVEQRKHPALGMFFDPKTQQNVIDYNRYQHEVVARNIRTLYRVIKQESQGRLLCGTYYGYVMYLAESPGFSQSSGHFALHTLLAAADTDYGIAPTTYSWRRTGQGPQSMTAFASFALHGKLWWDQADLRTHWSHQDYGRPPDLAGSIEHLRREAVRALTQGTAIQWYDFSNGWIFGDPRITAEVSRIQKLFQHRDSFAPLSREKTLAVFLDERQMGRFDPFHPPYASALIHRQIEHLARSGVPWRLYLFQDLLQSPDLLEHRAFLFLNLFHLTAPERRFLREKIMRPGRVAVFIGPAGALDEAGFDPENTSALLGLPVRAAPAPRSLAAKFAEKLPPPWTGCAGLKFGTQTTFAPVVLPRPEAAASLRVLAKFSQDGKPAACIHRRGGAVIVWSAAPDLPPEAIRAVARSAGIPVVSRSNDIFYIGRDCIGIHTSRSGSKRIVFPGPPGSVRELFSGRSWPGPLHRLQLDLAAGRTALFQISRAR